MKIASTRVVSIRPRSLEVENKQLIAAGGRLGWSTQVMLKKIVSSIPNVVEQQVYVTLASEVTCTPAKFARILRGTLPSRELLPHDFLTHQTGKRTTYSYGPELVDELRLAVEVSSSEGEDVWGFQLTGRTAAKIIAIYGAEAKHLFEAISEDLIPRNNARKTPLKDPAEEFCKRIIRCYEKYHEFIGLLTSDIDEILEHLEGLEQTTPKRRRILEEEYE